MKKGWQAKMLGEVCILRSGTTLPPSIEKPEGDLPYLKVADMNIEENDIYVVTSSRFVNKSDVNENGIIPIGSTIFPKRGGAILTNKKRLTTIPICMDLNLMAVSPRQELISKYLFYYFIGLDLGKINNGSSIPQINNYSIEPLQISYPPIPEQQRIVALLDEAFARLAQVHANAERNRVNAREVFEVTSNIIISESKADWEETKLGDICDFTRGPFGGSLKKNIFKKTGYAVYEQRHAIHKDYSEIRYFIDEAKFKEMERFELRPGDLIMSCSGVTLGRVSIAPENLKPGIINQALLKLTPIDNKISPEFLKRWMESESFQASIKAFSGGAAIPNVASVKILKEIPICLPSLEEQRAIVERLDGLAAETSRLEAVYQSKLEAVEELRKSVLKEAFEGRL